MSDSHSTVPLVLVSFTFAVQSPVMASCAAIDGLVKPYDNNAVAAINVIEQAIKPFFMFSPLVSLPASCSLMVCYRRRVSAFVFELSF